MVESEQVLVVPTSLFHELGHFQGLNREIDKYLGVLLTPANVSYHPRSLMEEDPSFKQLIPYVIFRYNDPDEGIKVFQYTRGKGQGEKRLHAKRSIGIGGHISSDDSVEKDPYAEGMRRELEEEVIIATDYTETCVGLINDDESEVGKVHLGVLHIFDVESPDVTGREDDICDAGFVSIDELKANKDQFETWSVICLESLF